MLADAFSQIVWGKPQLRDEDQWAANVKVVEMLCRTGNVSEWLEGPPDKAEYVRMPYHYDIQGVEIHFLPHWGFYTVEGYALNVPKTEEELNEAVEAFKTLTRLGLKPKKE